MAELEPTKQSPSPQDAVQRGPVENRRDRPARSSGSTLVAVGIFLSRIAGLVRQKIFAHFFGAHSLAADAFNAAFRIPNILQNLFGEGVLSASFIPEYSGLLAKEQLEEARRVAGAVVSALALISASLVLIGVVTAPYFVPLINPGFRGEKLELTIYLTQILFPGAGLLVFSAWCLGVLNSHRKFLLSYAAPLAWNAAMIGALLWGGPHYGASQSLAVALAWASVAGSMLQVLVQLPSVIRVAGRVRPHMGWGSSSVRTVFRNFAPAFVSRGVVQVSAFIDLAIASLIGVGTVFADGPVTALTYAQTLYMLPVSLFGMSVSAAELPEMSRAHGTDAEVGEILKARLHAALRRVAYFIVPTVVAFLALGDMITALLFQSGKFGPDQTRWVWGILGGATVGLLASTLGRLYASTFYALRDARTPLNFAVIRVVLSGILGYISAILIPRTFGWDPRLATVALAAASGTAGWVEFALLRRAMGGRIGRTAIEKRYLMTLWGIALGAAAVAWGVKLLFPDRHAIWQGVAALTVYGIVYVGGTAALRVPEAKTLTRRLETLRR
jgi:putative peptidoglycan lipid II flippase